jgi:D-alanyl-D-alanine carboxypeptidase
VRLLAVATIVAAAIGGRAGPGAAASSAASDRALDRSLAEAIESSGARSVSAAVIYPDGRIWSGARGIADLEVGEQARPSTSYALASITKTFVGAVAMQLVDEGVLTLDEPVSRWLPQLRGADGITLRQLLGHTSGLSETEPDPNPAHHWTPEEALTRMPDAACAPGACFGYVDTNYVAAGQVIAAAAGAPIEAVVRDRILEPLGLDHTWLQGFERPRGEVAPAQPSGTLDDPEGNTPSTDFVTRIGAAGAMAATATDLARFGHALFDEGLVSDASLATMTDVAPSTPLPCPDVERCPPAYGLGVGAEIVNGWEILGHSGSTGSLLAYFPEQRVTIAVLTNGGGDPYPAARAVADAIPATRNRVDLFTVGGDGSDPRRIGHRTGDRGAATISPDGKQIAYTARRGPDVVLVVAGIDGSSPRVVVDDLEEPGHASWSPDGRRLAFTARASARASHGELYIMDVDGTHRRQLTDGASWSDGPSWSPDGSLIAYHSYEGPEMEIRVVRPDGTHMRTVVRVPIRGRFMGYPRWAPDGSRLVFTGADGGDTDIQIVGLDGANLVTLTNDHVPEAEPAWSSDGRIAFTRGGNIFVVDPEVPDVVEQLTDSAGEEFALDWFPDASRIVFTTRR